MLIRWLASAGPGSAPDRRGKGR
ncbi:hypothetical protein XFF6994_1330002 [Xanthomonas citri pv. fuscans]|nr:hypothetical protein XFF6994_1330002 [Xanthomonas citri pv. fuscans]